MSLARLKQIDTSAPEWTLRLKNLISKITKINKNIEIYIFGSFAEGRFTSESDLDLAVIVPDGTSEKKFLEELYSNGHVSDWPLDLLIFPREKFDKKKLIGGVCFDINESGIELYPNWRLK